MLALFQYRLYLLAVSISFSDVLSGHFVPNGERTYLHNGQFGATVDPFYVFVFFPEGVSVWAKTARVCDRLVTFWGPILSARPFPRSLSFWYHPSKI